MLINPVCCRCDSLLLCISLYSTLYWFQCNEGTKVYLRVGGDIYYDPSVSEPLHDLLLIAGGIGINPLLSILYHVRDLITLKEKGNLEGDKLIPQKVLLLYSAAKQEELICKV